MLPRLDSSNARDILPAAVSPLHRQRSIRACLVAVSMFAGVHLVATAAAAPAPLGRDFATRQWHTDNGLPTEEVIQVAQDARGYLWVATTGRLVRFDGTTFKAAPDALGAVSRLLYAENCGLIVAPARGGLLVERDGAFEPDARFAAVGNRIVIALDAARDGAIWVGCDDGQVFRCTADGTRAFSVPRGLPGARRIGFAQDQSGRTWIASDMTVLRYEAGELHLFPQEFGGEELRIATSFGGTGPWLLSETQLWQFDGGRFRAQTNVTQLLGAHYVQAFIEDRTGDLWLATRSKGLARYRGGVFDTWSAVGEDIYDVMEDSSGHLWASANGAGLARLRRLSYELFNRDRGLAVDFSSTVCADARGHLWFANRDGGIVEWDGSALTSHRPLPDWPAYSAVSLFPLADGVGFTCGSGAYRITPGAPIRKYNQVPITPAIRRTRTLRNGDTWLAIGPDRLGRLRGEELTELPANAVRPDIRALGEDQNGALLVGTGAGELLRLEGERLTPFNPAVPGGLGAIQCIFVDSTGALWLGAERGLLVSTSNSGWSAVRREHGLLHENISAILADDRGHLWFGCEAGIFALSRRAVDDFTNGRIARLQPMVLADDGSGRPLSCVANAQPAAWRTPDGRLWFATRRGVVALDPHRETVASPPLRLTLETFRTDALALPHRDGVRVPAGADWVEFGFSALCLATPEHVRVRYRLDGFDREWVDAGAARSTRYSRLPPGDYTFRVAAALPEQTTPATVALAFTLAPEWWQTLWFKTVAVLLGGTLVFGAARYWSNLRIRRKLERIERESVLERERTRIARDIHDDLGASLSRISLLTQSANRPDDPAQPGRLAQIYETVSQITRSMDEIVWAVDPKHDHLEALVSYLTNYAQRYLAPAAIRCRLDLPASLPHCPVTSQVRHQLYLCLKEALHNVVRHSGATEVTVAFAITPDGAAFTLTDNGRGLGQASAPGEDRIASGNGVANMHQRMAGIGGRCTLESAPAGGTRVTFIVPVESIAH